MPTAGNAVNLDTAAYVQWFRNSSPYINAHQGRTFVVYVPGEAVAGACFATLIHDIALLDSLGIRLVLVHGARKQIGDHLARHHIETRFEKQTRVTTAEALPYIEDAVGRVRIRMESQLSLGLANSPMHNARLRVVSGNFVTARPLGVRDGFDYQHTGEVRRVDVAAITAALDASFIVLLSPLGYSPTGEVFNLDSEDVATAAAVALKADKLIFLGEDDGVRLGKKKLVRDLTPAQASELLAGNKVKSESAIWQLEAAAHAASHGVGRVHLIGYNRDGALLQELFTRDGCGTLVTAQTYEQLRTAGVEDVGGILELIRPLEDAGVLVRRSRELLETEIRRFHVIERDGMVIGCAALYPLASQAGELACVAVHEDYRNSGRATMLLDEIEKRAQAQGMHRLFTLTTQTAHWFQERGFVAAKPDTLPEPRKSLYNWQRNSKVFVKNL
ncbi:MAG: amino-acid N-acetyltransferase [Pseudomonadota bacterium]